jgi:hypothetical protein
MNGSLSDRGHSWLVKLVIVTIVFPVLVLGLRRPWKLVLFGLAWLLPVGTQWVQWVGWCAAIVGVTLAGYVALWICRLIWPKARTSSHA